MAIIRKNGAPTKHTVGATGDFYDDLDSGKRYECACICTVSGGFQEYEWREVEQIIDAEPIMSEDIPEEKTVIEEPEEIELVVEEEKTEQPVNNQQYNPNRNNNRNGYKTQYNKQYRPNNK